MFLAIAILASTSACSALEV